MTRYQFGILSGVTGIAIVLGVLLFLGYVNDQRATAGSLSVKRMAVIEELDKGFLVKCAQGDQQNPNPYPYRRASAGTREDASKEAGLCFEGKAGWPEDRRRK